MSANISAELAAIRESIARIEIALAVSPASVINRPFERSQAISIIQRAVADRLGIELEALKGRSRQAEVIWARHIAIFLSHEILDLSYNACARQWNMDHANITHACHRVMDRCGNNKRDADMVLALRTGLASLNPTKPISKSLVPAQVL